MRYFFLILAFMTFWSSLNIVSAATSTTMCTTEYAPVCGMVDVQCITTPCDPVRTDFSNLCMAQVAGARDITGGMCIMSESPTPIGWSRDAHGCLTGAGYSWNYLAKQCLRSWESRVRVVVIAPETTPCLSGMTMTGCLQMRIGGKSVFISRDIDGFDFVPGYTYRLRVLETRGAGESTTYMYSLLKIIGKRIVPVRYDELLVWDWYMIAYNDTNILSLSSIRAQDLTLSFTKDRFSARICNSISGDYTLYSWILHTEHSMSTRMACQNTLISTMESVWDLEGATYTIASARYMSGSSGPGIWLTITTKSGDTFTYTR